jgi:hypothetical protein
MKSIIVRRLTLVASLVSLGALAGTLAVSAAPASATTIHKYESQITEAGEPLAPFAQPWGLTFDKEGSLYLGDAEGPAVDVFNASNVFTTQIGKGSGPEKFNFPEEFVRSVAVSDTTGDVYVAESGAEDVDVFKPAGGGKFELLQEKKFGGFLYVAVDNSSGERGGDVYVWSSSPAVHVIKPTAEGKLEEAGTELPPPGSGFSCAGSGGLSHTCKTGVAVDSATGKVYVASPVSKVVDEYNDKGELEPSVLTGAETPAKSFEPIALAVDASNSEVYVVDAAHKVVDEFDSEGKYLGQITETEEPNEPLAEPLGVAVNGTGHVYISDASKKVIDVFGPDEEAVGGPPTEVETGLAEEVTATSAKLTGKLNPNGASTEYYFEYGTEECSVITETCGTKTIEGSPLGGITQQPVGPLEVKGLTPGTTYHYWIVAKNAKGGAHGEQQTFTTEAALPTEVETGPAEEVTATSAKLTGKLNPNGTPAKYYFEYGTAACTATCGTKTIEGSPLGGITQQPVGPLEVKGLTPGTTYHYWIVAKNTAGTVHGEEQTFETKTLAPTEVSTEPASAVTGTSAKLNGKFNPGGTAKYYFEYGTAACGANTCGTKTSEGGPLTAGNQQTVSPLEVKGLTPGATYHYWIVAKNTVATVHGNPQTFTTEVVMPSEVGIGAASEVTATTAEIGGDANPGGSAMYFVEYGTSQCTIGNESLAWWYCASQSAEEGSVSGVAQQALTPIKLTGLKPETTYKYWIFVYNAQGAEHGEEAEFKTLPSPIVIPPAEVKIVTPPIVTGLTPPGPGTPVVKTPTRAEKLAKALKVCKKKPKKKRAACIKRAHKKYGPVKKKKKKG